jgi:hypothetical protein
VYVYLCVVLCAVCCVCLERRVRRPLRRRSPPVGRPVRLRSPKQCVRGFVCF